MSFGFLYTEYISIRCGEKIHQTFFMGNRSVSGGDINIASILTLSNAGRVFVKENRAELVTMFSAEAEGLQELASAGEEAPPVPRPLAWGVDESRAFLLMEVVEKGRLTSAEDFGASLAAMHRNKRSEFCGFSVGNRIGMSVQDNREMKSWYEFFRAQRLGYQWNMARQKGYGDRSAERLMQLLLNRLENLLPEPDEGLPSLLHGDLWGGNWIAGSDGRGWLIDPFRRLSTGFSSGIQPLLASGPRISGTERSVQSLSSAESSESFRVLLLGRGNQYNQEVCLIPGCLCQLFSASSRAAAASSHAELICSIRSSTFMSSAERVWALSGSE